MGLSFGKLVVLAVIILVVWYGLKYTKQVEEVRRMLRREMAARQGRARPRGGGTTLAAEDLVKCERCGAYVVQRSTTSCGRADCPWGR